MTTPVAADRPTTSRLLVLLFDYVAAHTATHPALLPAVASLREAAQAFGRGETRAAFERGVAVFRLLQGVRATSPDLPEP